MPATIVSRSIAITCCFLIASSRLDADEPAAENPTGEQKQPAELSFVKNVQPIFSQHCYGCHQGAKQLGSFLMTDFKALLKGGESEQAAIVPGQPDQSYLVQQITPIDGHAEMPDAPFKPLNEIELETIRNWILQGAKNDASGDSGPRYTTDNPPNYVGPPSLPSIDVSPDGSKIAVAAFYEVVLLDAESGQNVGRLVGLSPRINSVRFSPDGKRLAAVGGTPSVRGEVQIWDLDSKS